MQADFSHTIIPATNARSLVWSGDSLTDWVSGGIVYGLDGSSSPPLRDAESRFDAAVASKDGEFVALYSRCGSQALLLRNGKPLRELSRTEYVRHEYPICFATFAGRTLLAHCPDRDDKLEIEDAETGQRLTTRSLKPSDFYHSRLSVSPDERYLMSAGWIWHPWDAVTYYDIEEAIQRPEYLDELGLSAPTSGNACLAEEVSACWQTGTRAIVTGGDESEDPETAQEETGPRLRPYGVVVFDVPSCTVLSECVLESLAGTVMAVGSTHVVAFYKSPRLIRLSDGLVEASLPSVPSGTQLSSFCHGQAQCPVLALDPPNARFAIAQADQIDVVTLQISGA